MQNETTSLRKPKRVTPSKRRVPYDAQKDRSKARQAVESHMNQFSKEILFANSPEEVENELESCLKTYFETRPDLLSRITDHVIPGQTFQASPISRAYQDRTPEGKRQALYQIGAIVQDVLQYYAKDSSLESVQMVMADLMQHKSGQNLFSQAVLLATQISDGVINKFQAIPSQSTFKRSL